jgi:hypothetical protein
MAAATILSLSEVKAHLRYPVPSAASPEDNALMGFIAAAQDVLVSETDVTATEHYLERHSGGAGTLWVHHPPILSVQSVRESIGGYITWELDFVQVDSANSSPFAYSIDSNETGAISRRAGGGANIPFIPGVMNIEIDYQAGRLIVPPSIRLAGLELIAEWWQNSQLRASMAIPGNTAYSSFDQSFTRTTGLTTINFGVPMRILELLKRYRRGPIIG